MSSHPELAQLSAYLDGELAASERTALEAHLPTCAECRSTLDALRATIADLGALPEAVPTEQDSWALRSAIARARKPSNRWQRAAWAAGAVAAAAIAVVAIVRPGGGGTADLATGQSAEGALEAGGPASVDYNAGAFDAGSAQAKLLQISGKVPGRQALPLHKDASAPTGEAVAPAVGGGGAPAAQYGVTTDSSDPTKEIDRCVAEVRKSTQEYLQPIEYDVGTFESKPAFLLFFQTRSRYELWVVQRPSCAVLYFAQAA